LSKVEEEGYPVTRLFDGMPLRKTGHSLTPASNETSFFAFQEPDDYDRFRDVLEKAGYTDSGVLEALGVKDFPSIRGSDTPLLLRRTNRGTPLDTIIRLFLIEVPCGLKDVQSAVQPIPLETLARAGLVEIAGSSVTAAVKLLPFRNLLVAFDSTRRLRSPDRHDYVMGIGSSSLTLANLTVRRHARATLDLGTGCGIQALLAAPHSARVVAVDRNPRAVRLATFNARLNGLSNVECRDGDFLEPLQGETFDLVISNPPFVISPERRYIYRDGGMAADAVCQRIVREVPRFLEEGGYCQILCNWVHLKGQDWQERLAGWFEGSGCDAWVMRSETRDAATYASTWIRHTERGEPEGSRERFDTWMDYYEKLGIEAVSAGVITMRRAAGRLNWYRCDDGPEKMLGPCGDSVLRGFELRDFLDTVREDSALLDARTRVSPDVRLRRQSEPSPEGWVDVSTEIHLTRGLAYSGSIDPYVANLTVGCDGRRPLRELLAEMAASLGKSEAEIASAFCVVVRGLIERGFLLPEHFPV
jgi:SAM-dependent methyltransferase